MHRSACPCVFSSSRPDSRDKSHVFRHNDFSHCPSSQGAASLPGVLNRMFVPTTFTVALIMTIVSTICWGSFANTFKGTRNYRFELYYWDYGLGIFLISVVLALTMGSHAGGPTAFLAKMHAADNLNFFYAAL